MRAQREEPQAPTAFCKDVERTGADQWETPVGKIFHDLWADLDTSLGASLEPPSSEIAKQICPVPHEEIQGFDEVFDGSDGSDEESVVFKEYALGQLQKWIQRTVERSPAKG